VENSHVLILAPQVARKRSLHKCAFTSLLLLQKVAIMMMIASKNKSGQTEKLTKVQDNTPLSNQKKTRTSAQE
jgi:hypothetical protein